MIWPCSIDRAILTTGPLYYPKCTLCTVTATFLQKLLHWYARATQTAPVYIQMRGWNQFATRFQKGIPKTRHLMHSDYRFCIYWLWYIDKILCHMSSSALSGVKMLPAFSAQAAESTLVTLPTCIWKECKIDCVKIIVPQISFRITHLNLNSHCSSHLR